MTNRRSFLLGAAALLAVPAIVRADSLMRLAPKQLILPDRLKWRSPGLFGFLPVDGNERLYASIHGEAALIRGGRKFFREPRGPMKPAYVPMGEFAQPIVAVSRPDRFTGPDGKLLDYYPPDMKF